MLVTPAALLVQAQAQQPAQSELPKNPGEELQAARDAQHRNADLSAKVNLPMATEPAVHFKA